MRPLLLAVLLTACGASTEPPVVSDAAVDSGTTDALGGATCGDTKCGTGEICTRTHTTGGACLACGDDASACPTGSHCAGACCAPDVPAYSYACAAVPSSCAAAPSCGACGDALCSGGCPCESVSGSLVTCHCLAP